MKTATTAFFAIASMLTMLVGCGGPDEPEQLHDLAQLKAALAQPGGGFDTQSESPGFGMPNLQGTPGQPSAGENPLTSGDPDTRRCPRGLLAGTWVHVGQSHGFFYGRYTDQQARLGGYLKGIYGITAAGQRVFYGKAIGKDGAFVALLKGHYAGSYFGGTYDAVGGGQGKLSGHSSVAACDTGANTCAPARGTFRGSWRAACLQDTQAETEPQAETNRQAGTNSQAR